MTFCYLSIQEEIGFPKYQSSHGLTNPNSLKTSVTQAARLAPALSKRIERSEHEQLRSNGTFAYHFWIYPKEA